MHPNVINTIDNPTEPSGPWCRDLEIHPCMQKPQFSLPQCAICPYKVRIYCHLQVKYYLMYLLSISFIDVDNQASTGSKELQKNSVITVQALHPISVLIPVYNQASTGSNIHVHGPWKSLLCKNYHLYLYACIQSSWNMISGITICLYKVHTK